MRGVIALDIDGTLTHGQEAVPKEVIAFLEELAIDGWQLLFITGRTFRWGHQALSSLSFPYYFAVQNGALILKMPSCEVVQRHYLRADQVAPLLSAPFLEMGVAIYNGYEGDDSCYFSRPTPPFLQRRAEREKWQQVSFLEDSFQSTLRPFASLKYFGEKQALAKVQQIAHSLHLHSPLVADPYYTDPYYTDPYHADSLNDLNHLNHKDLFVLQVTHPLATKGAALKELCQQLNYTGPIIAAGDEENDLPLLQAATIKIAMGSGNPHLQQMADIVAPPVQEKGIIAGLKLAIASHQSSK